MPEPGLPCRGAHILFARLGAGEEIPTRARRIIDLVVYRSGSPVALIEAESDLNDLVNSGTTRRNGHYDVASIGRSANGANFNSYKSLERMASAAFYFSWHNNAGTYPEPLVGSGTIKR